LPGRSRSPITNQDRKIRHCKAKIGSRRHLPFNFLLFNSGLNQRLSTGMRHDPHIAPATRARLPLRPCVGVMLLNRQGLVWVGRRLPKWFGDKSAYIWQMPQGGITSGEAPEHAALRELEEETSVRSVEILGEAGEWLEYELPKHLLGIALKGRYRGQRQKWFAMRFTGKDSEIDISARNGHKAEFDAWRWARVEELPELAVSFKRPIYETLSREFGHFARPT
jgi:putative (di)nucleoside polyphosphate hydrolase